MKGQSPPPTHSSPQGPAAGVQSAREGRDVAAVLLPWAQKAGAGAHLWELASEMAKTTFGAGSGPLQETRDVSGSVFDNRNGTGI